MEKGSNTLNWHFISNIILSSPELNPTQPIAKQVLHKGSYESFQRLGSYKLGVNNIHQGRLKQYSRFLGEDKNQEKADFGRLIPPTAGKLILAF